jgi:hypothetical protein
VVFFFLETKTSISHLLISDERFMAFNKNPLGVFKCEHKKKLGGFVHIGISVKVDWVNHFWGFAGESLMQTSSKITWTL